MTRTPREVAQAYWAAEARRDLAGVMSFYGESSVFRLLGRTYRGPEESLPGAGAERSRE